MIEYNIFFWIILITLLSEFIISKISDYLNLQWAGKPMPDALKGVYDDESYRKSIDYHTVTTRFSWLVASVDLVIMLTFWLAGGFPVVWTVAGMVSPDQIIRGLVFIGLLMAGRSVFSIPFGLYSTFVIEERFGFNKTTVKTWILDRIKGLGLGLVLGLPVLAALLWFFSWSGTSGWLIAWGGVTVFSLLVQFIAPIWIMPLFNKFTPLEAGDLRNAILAVAEKAQFPLKDIYVIDGSRRSTKGNAYFTGFGKNKRIALYDTMVAGQTTEEIVAVVAHEIGHYKLRHIPLNMVISILHTGVLFFLLSISLGEPGLFAAFGMTEISVAAGFIFFGMLYAPVEFILGILMAVLSRTHEFQADRYAKELTGLSAELISALKKLSRQNFSQLTPHPLTVFLEYSHPPLADRMARLEG